jgi:3-dehydroquinate synthase
MHQTINVSLGDRSYPIHIGAGTLSLLLEEVQKQSTKGTVGIVTDSNVVHEIPAGEQHKRLSRIEEICGTFLDAGLDRSSMIVALGGGVVGDISGFAAAVFMRGIPFIQIPTTIVAQVDSSVGGKTGVNHPLSKNSIGAFHQPKAVIIDMALLQSLPDRELRAGLAEAIKHGIIADAALFNYMNEHVDAILAKDAVALEVPIRRSCEIKSAIVMEDELEHGKRANLNYGHTFGHAIESVTEYKTYLHGEAISIGMCAAGHLAHQLGMVDEAFVAQQKDCFQAYGLPTYWAELPVEETLAAMSKDKKVRAGTLKFILATGMGNVIHRTDVEPDAVRAALEAVRHP